MFFEIANRRHTALFNHMFQDQIASAKNCIEEIDDLIDSVKSTQKIYKVYPEIYPPSLDDMIDEFYRDARCCRRRWEIVVERLSDESSAPELDKLIGDYRSIQELALQTHKKVDDILLEFRGLQDILESLLGGDSFDSSEEWDDE
jgi:hypothetical protein